MAAEAGKHAAAEAALAQVRDGMAVGLGTGSTAALMVEGLARRVAAGLNVTGVATSEATAAQAAGLGIALAGLEATGPLDLTIDGADEIDPALRLIKGGGGALLREKIVAAASRRMIVIADETKQVACLGRFPLPVEIVAFAPSATARAVAAALAEADVDSRGAGLRMAGAEPFRTDEGHLILDLALGRIGDAAALDARLRAIPGVVETGLFLGLAAEAFIGRDDGGHRHLIA